MTQRPWTAADNVSENEPVEVLRHIDVRVADLRKANDVFRESSWDQSRDIQRNDREIRWLIDFRTMLATAAPQTPRIAVAAALARRLCQFFDSGGESQRSVRARHASAIFQLLDAPEYRVEQQKLDADPRGYLEAAEAFAFSRPDRVPALPHADKTA